MIYVVIIAVALALIYGPQLWVQWVLNRYNRHPEDNFPGTGGELARHLLDRYDLQEIKVEVTDAGDHYDPMERAVRLTRDKHDGKTLTAITVASAPNRAGSTPITIGALKSWYLTRFMASSTV